MNRQVHMGSIKKRARDTSKFVLFHNEVDSPCASTLKQKVGRFCTKPALELKSFGLSITILVGDGNVDPRLLANIQWFYVEKTLVEECSLERVE